MAVAPPESRKAALVDFGVSHDADHARLVERMIDAARVWLRQRARLQGRVPVTMLSGAEHDALKTQMFAAVADEVAYHPDLDRAIAYLQALGKLAAAYEEPPAGKAG